MNTSFTSDSGRNASRLTAFFGANPTPPPGHELRPSIAESVAAVGDGSQAVAHNAMPYSAIVPPSPGQLLPPGLVLPAERVVADVDEMSSAMLNAAASAAPLPGLPSTDGDISSGGWTDEEEREQTLNGSFLRGRSPYAPVPLMPAPRAAMEVMGNNDQSNDINSSSRFSAPPPGLPIPARRLSRTPNPPVDMVDVKKLDELNASFANIYMDTSRNISSSSPARVDLSIAPDVAPIATSSPLPPMLDEICSRFSAPCLPQQPLSPGQNDTLDLFAKAKAIVSKSATAAGIQKSTAPTSILDTITNYFPLPESIADISMLPRELVALVDNCPEVFVVECEKPAHLKVKLRCPATLDNLAPKSVRQAIEADLVWMDPANCIVPLNAQQFICVAAMYFIPPRGIIFASFWGNDRAERFRHVQSLIEPFVPILKPVERVIPGMPCIVREGGDYARAVVVDRADAGLFKLICMDNYAFVSAPSGDIFYLPDELGTDHIKCSIFLARIRGVSSVPMAAQGDITQMIDEMMRSLMCTAGVLYPAKGPDHLCVADIVLQDTEIWLSNEIQKNFRVDRMAGDLTFDAAMTNSKVVAQYQAGYYEFDRTVMRLKEAPGMEELLHGVRKSEDNAKQEESVPVEVELGQQVEPNGGALFNNDSHICPIEQEGLLASAVDALVEEDEQPAAPFVEEKHQPVAVAQTSDLAHHIRNHSAFVDFMLAGADDQATKMCVIHNAISQALFLKRNYAPESNDDIDAIDGFIAHFKHMA